MISRFSPREGYGLHPDWDRLLANAAQRFSPREGYGLHLRQADKIIVKQVFQSP